MGLKLSSRNMQSGLAIVKISHFQESGLREGVIEAFEALSRGEGDQNMLLQFHRALSRVTHYIRMKLSAKTSSFRILLPLYKPHLVII